MPTKNRQSERTGKLHRLTLQNIPAPKGTRMCESGRSQSGKMSSPGKSVTIKSSSVVLVLLQTSGFEHNFYCQQVLRHLPSGKRKSVKKRVVAPVLPNIARKLFDMVAMLQMLFASVHNDEKTQLRNREIIPVDHCPHGLYSLASYSVNAYSKLQDKADFRTQDRSIKKKGYGIFCVIR